MRSLLYLICLIVPLSAQGQAQTFSWFATTMSSSDASLSHARVRVLPETVWQASDSLVQLTPDAAAQVAASRRDGLKVIAAVGAGYSGAALLELWDGVLDGLIIPAGAFPEPVTRPESTVLLASAPEDQTMDGALEAFSAAEGEWAAIDSVFASRAATAEDPLPRTTIVVPQSGASLLSVLSPGSVLANDDVKEGAEPLLEFRADHPAIASGIHEQLSLEPYAFYRGFRVTHEDTDQVVVVAGARGSTRINVSSIFDDDVILRDRLTGQIALVSFGQVVINAGPTGMLLLEMLD